VAEPLYSKIGISEYPLISFHASMENFVVAMSDALETATLFIVQNKFLPGLISLHLVLVFGKL